MAGDHDSRRHGVENREQPDLHHKSLKFVSLCPVVFHDGADFKEGDEARQEEQCPQHQVGEQGGQNEARQGVQVLVAHVTHPGEFVGVHDSHDEYDDGFNEGYPPRSEMEVCAVHLDSFMTPLKPGR